MKVLDVSFSIPPEVLVNLQKGSYKRVGGVIQDALSGHTVSFLREVGEFGQLAPKLLDMMGAVSGVGVLNLGISAMGFAVVFKRLADIERRLQRTQEVLQQIDRKLDLSFYANFRAALDLALNAFTMSNQENRKTSAMQAVNRFMEAKHHYAALADTELNARTQVADDYVATLSLAYVAEALCYLELEELDSATRLLAAGAADLGGRTRQHLNTLLTDNPAAYLHPSLKRDVDLRRLTRVFQWLNPAADAHTVFESQRDNLFNFKEAAGAWAESLPTAVWDPAVDGENAVALPKPSAPAKSKWSGLVQLGKSLPGFNRGSRDEVFKHLPTVLTRMEVMVEDYGRFQMYQAEIRAARRLEMSFDEWRRLKPTEEPRGESAGVIFITPSEPLDLAA